VTWRYRVAQLSRRGVRRTVGRLWFAVCSAGAIVTLGLAGGRHLFIVIAVWLVCVFVPGRIAIEALQAWSPRVRETLRREVARRGDRYDLPGGLAVMAELLYEREVRPPRLAPPDLAARVTDASVALCRHAGAPGARSNAVHRAAMVCGSLLDRWLSAIAASEQDSRPPAGTTGGHRAAGTPNGARPPVLWDADASIQDQWVVLRAVAGLGALTAVLILLYEDTSGRQMDGGGSLRAVADAAMDYVDQVGLGMDGPPWESATGIPLAPLSQDLAARLAETWVAFCQTPLPAPRRLGAFIDSLPQ